MPKQMSGKTFSNLLEYYIECLEQEDMLSVTFDVSAEKTAFLTNPSENEVFFHTDNTEVRVVEKQSIKEFFQTSLLQQKEKTLFYGYPVVIEPQGNISPLFFIEVEYKKKDDGVLITNISAQKRMNPSVLLRCGFSAEELNMIREETQNESISQALSSFCSLFHANPADFSAILDSKPLKRTLTPLLVNKSLLYFAQRTDITRNLILELGVLKKKPLDDIASTSLLPLLTEEIKKNDAANKKAMNLELFALNPSQEHAMTQTLARNLTVITGPPGTGKSQVVLNIIANAVYQNKTVLFASKNNKAVDVVIDKFNAILPYKLLIRMGNQSCRRAAKADLEALLKEQIRNNIKAQNTKTQLLTTLDEIKRLHHQLEQLVALNDAICRMQTNSDSYRNQLPCEFQNNGFGRQLKCIDLLLLQKDVERYFEKQGIHRLLKPFHQSKKKEQVFRSYYDKLPENLKATLQKKLITNEMSTERCMQWILRLKKLTHASDEILELNSQLTHLPSYQELKQGLGTCQTKKIKMSRSLFEEHWIHKLLQATDEEKQQIRSYFSVTEQLESWVKDRTVLQQLRSQQLRTMQKTLAFFPVWVVTNLSAKNSFPLKNNLFDLLIIDEASQCDIASALPLMYRAKHAVIIGDPHQLKHISLLSEQQDRTLSVQKDLAEVWFSDYSYSKRSLYDLAEGIIVKNNEHPVLLNEHYRCHSDIVSFSNEYYYQRQLRVETDESRLITHPLLQNHIFWHDVKGKTAHAKSPYNEKEAEAVVEELLKITGQPSSAKPSVGVVTLFRAQADMIEEKIRRSQDVVTVDITIGTAHRFQGDEKDIIVFSPAVSDEVKSGTMSWIQTTSQLINVAVTRAKSFFLIVGDHQVCLQSSGPLKDLAEYVKNRNCMYDEFDSAVKQVLYTELKKHHLPVSICRLKQKNSPDNLYLALCVNGKRYALLINEKEQSIYQQQLMADGLRVRQFLEQDIKDDISSVIQQIKRLC